MKNFSFQALQAYNYWYPPSRVASQIVGILPCGHRGLIGAPLCKTCADALIRRSLTDEDQDGTFINDLVIAYDKERQSGTALTENGSHITSIIPSFAEDFINHLRHTNHAEGTITIYAIVLSLFFAYLSSDPLNYTVEELAKVDHRRIESFLSHCRKKRNNSPASIAHKQSTIKSLYRYLIHQKLLTTDATEKLDAIYVQERFPKALDPKDVTKLADALNSSKRYKWTKMRDRAIVFTLLGTGLRVSELRNLNITDIDFVRGYMRIIGMSGDGAIVAFGTDVESTLRSYLEIERPRYEAKLNSPALFLSIRGTRISVDAIQVLVVNILESIGIQGFNTHKLRTTAAALLLRETGNLDLVKDFMRYKDPAAAGRYATILQDDLRRAAKQIKIK